MGLLRRMQELGKSVQLWPLLNCTVDELVDEVAALCRGLDPTRLFIVAEVDSVERARAVIAKAREISASKRKTLIRVPKTP
jgi:hypothetical protein